MPRAFDTTHYRTKYGLPGWVRGPFARAHYSLLGSRRGHEPDAQFDPGFFLQQVKRRGLPPVGLRSAWATYLDNPSYWSVDPQLRTFFPHEPFASSAPVANPLLAARDLPAVDTKMGYGNPLLDPAWWVETRGLPATATLRDVMDDANRAAEEAASRHGVVALGPPVDVLIINGEDHCPACTQYRVWNPAIALRSRGLNVAIVDAQDIVDDRLRGVDLTARAVIIFRARVDGQLLGVVDALRAKGAQIGFDCDDLIFDRPHTVGLQPDEFGHRDVRSVNRHSAGMQAFIERADFAVVPTSTLGRVLIDAGIPPDRVWTCPSFLSPAQAAGFQKTDGSRDPNVISIASGTWTHQEDVKALVGPLARFMEQHPGIRLRVFGALALDRFPELEPMTGRIDQDARVIRDWNAYVKRYSESAVNLVSMDFDNGFCHGKSEVKYIEASLAGTATLATGIEAFERALSPIDQGTLVRNEDDWSAALERIVDRSTGLDSIRAAVHADVLTRYGPSGEHAATYVDAVITVLDQGSIRRGSELPCRWTIDSANAPVDTRLLGAARQLGAAGVEVVREPRETNVRISAGNDVGGSSRLAPWVDPAIFFGRSSRPAGVASDVTLIAPMGPVSATDLGPMVRTWRAYVEARGGAITVIGSRGEALGLPRAPHWLRGGSAVELATLLRRSDLVVQLSPEWTEELVGALLVGTPVALRDDAADDGSLPQGWRMARADAAP